MHARQHGNRIVPEAQLQQDIEYSSRQALGHANDAGAVNAARLAMVAAADQNAAQGQPVMVPRRYVAYI